jgi:hypothetical protein
VPHFYSNVLKGEAVANRRVVSYLECSGKTGEGVDKLITAFLTGGLRIVRDKEQEERQREVELKREAEHQQKIREAAVSMAQDMVKLQQEKKEKEREEERIVQPKKSRMDGFKRIVGMR